ncbi:MAG TPA: NUDIX hydrolase [Actinomycetota bacterium]|nr:NUDIX hydrolase [Actinomycetota bacterium]
MEPRPAHVDEVFRGSLFSVEVQTWERPRRRREVVRHPGAVGIVAVTGEGAVVLVRQFREAVREPVLEIPAGVRDVRGEDPAETARRELAEETGYRATSVRPLGRIHSSPGFTDETVELFVAGAEPGGEPEPGVEVVTMALQDALSAVSAGSITDAKTVTALLLAGRAAPPA